MASESSCVSEFGSATEGFEAPEIHLQVLTDASAALNYENIVIPNAPIQKYAKNLI